MCGMIKMKYIILLFFLSSHSYSCDRICEEINIKQHRIKILQKQILILKEIKQLKQIKKKAIYSLKRSEKKMEKAQDQLNDLFDKEFQTFLYE